MEKDAGNIYDIISNKSEGEISEVASIFRKQEIIHAERIQILGEKHRDKEVSIRSEIMYLPEYSLQSERISEDTLNFSTRKELFLFALRGEKDSILLYSEFGKEFDVGSDENIFFEKLANEERGHMYYILQKLHELQ